MSSTTRLGRALCTLVWALALVAPGLARPAFAAGTTPDFVGDFGDFGSAAWKGRWGIVPDTLRCKILVGTFTCNWGYDNVKAVSDPETPGGGQALEVSYPAPSGPPSCDCGLGGAQLYQDLKTAGHAALADSPSVSLKYWYKFPVGFDFGKSTGGKLPGLYGGEPGCQSGGQRCDKAWSTRYMWRGGGQSAPDGEIYWYSGNGSGFGEDLGHGSWKFIADGKWHAIEQLVNVSTGKITIWHDGEQKFTATKSFGGGTVTGIFFSTFHGGHDTSWSPSKLTKAYFANFTLATDGPQTAAASGPPDAGSGPTVDAGQAAGSGGAGGVIGAGGAGGAGGASSEAGGGAAAAPTGSGGASPSTPAGAGGAMVEMRPGGAGGQSAPSAGGTVGSAGCRLARGGNSAPVTTCALLFGLALWLRGRRRSAR